MLVSVIVPVYNVEKYLSKCIDSILAQTYTDLEIILVDDGSPDNCGKICDEYAEKDSRIKVIHKANEGQAVARNVALDICSGDYIAFVDSDDRIHPEMISGMLTAVCEDNCDIGICGIIFQTSYKETSFGYNKKTVFENPELIKYYINHKITSVMWDKLYARHLFKTIRFPAIRAREDAYVLPELLGNCNRAVLLPKNYYIQNIREGSTEQKPISQEKIDTTVLVVNHQKEYLGKYYPELYRDIVLENAKMHYYFLKEIIAKNHSGFRDSLYQQQLEGLKVELRNVDISELSYEQQNEFRRLQRIEKYPHMFWFYRKAVLLFRNIQKYFYLK